MKKKHIIKKVLALVVLSIVLQSSLFAKQIKLLAIGNSFSHDALEYYLHGLVQEVGDEIIIGIAYISGSSLEQHYDNSVNNAPQYEYRKIINGVREVENG